MTNEEFESLSLYEKEQYIWSQGKYVDFREFPEVTLQLYAVGKRFYEVYFVGEDNEITQIKEIGLDDVMKFYGGEGEK
ncbi:MAG TPA: hypothetical protein VIK89_07810 [Cytophagaceae bacterium]